MGLKARSQRGFGLKCLACDNPFADDKLGVTQKRMNNFGKSRQPQPEEKPKSILKNGDQRGSGGRAVDTQPAPSAKKAPEKATEESLEGSSYGVLASTLKRLKDLPDSWWTKVPNDSGGYQYKTVVHFMSDTSKPVDCLLDGCAGVNSVSEELVIGLINHAKSRQIKTDDPRYPILQMEWWPETERVAGVAAGKTIVLLGAVVLRVQMTELGKKTGPEILVRAKIFEKNGTDWHGLILGGQALDCVERGGLGHRPGSHAHVLEGLGIMMP